MSQRSDSSEDPEHWMRPFMLPPADIEKVSRDRAQYAPPSRDPALRRAQEEELLTEQIWILALSEAYSTMNQGWLRAMQGQSKPQIADDFLRRHPPMARFVQSHIEAGTCAKAVEVLEEERARRRAGPPSAITQEQVSSWFLAYFEAARKEGRPPPKMEDDAFLACRRELGATDQQMRAAASAVPADRKRSRGARDRKRS